MTADGVIRYEDGTSARAALLAALRGVVPKRWQLIDTEQRADDSQRPRLRVSQRTIKRGIVARYGVHTITFSLTITVPTGDGIADAEPRLDDELDAFLWALDGLGVHWEQAEKALFSDEGDRLGYSIQVDVQTDKLAKDEG